MMVVGVLMAVVWAQMEGDPLMGTLEFVGSLIGILGVVFFIAGLFYTPEPVLH